MKVSDHRRTAGELARFVLVGLLNTGFGYCVYAAGILAGLAPEVALLATFTVALLFNYMTTGRIVFRNAGAGHFPRFAFAYVVIYGINVIVLRAVLGLGVDPLAAQAAVLLPVVLCTFLIMKLFVFRSRRNAQDH